LEESIAGHVGVSGVNGVYWKLGKGNPDGSQEAEGVGFSSPGAFKTYANLWEGRNQVIPLS
jgi:hypothetical protein